MKKAPEITVTCSIPGCQCGGILKPAGTEMRIVNGRRGEVPLEHGIFAPFGSEGGPSTPLDVR